MLEAGEFLGRLIRRPNPVAAEVKKLRLAYDAQIKRILGDQNKVTFTVESRPDTEDFRSPLVWPYYLDLTPPVSVTVEKGLKGSLLHAVSHEDLEVQFELNSGRPIIMERRNLPYIRPHVFFNRNDWNRRKAYLEFGLDLANFVAKHQPVPREQST